MKSDQLWKATLGQLELRVSQENFSTWFEKTRIIDRTDDGVVLIETPTVFAFEWLSKKYYGPILEIMTSLDKKVEKLDFCIASHGSAPQISRNKASSRIVVRKNVAPRAQAVAATAPRVAASASVVESRTKGTLNPKYTFDSYVTGSSNEIAFAACQAVARGPGREYNPLFLYGGVGLGKTHLLQAVGNEVLTNNPHMKVMYVSAETFTNDFVMALKERKLEHLKAKYRKVDVFIIDDVQFLAGKVKVQEELFHTYNELYGAGKQVILSSDRPPQAIPTFTDRLRSRLGGGMVLDIKQPDYETRLAIVRQKVEERGVEIDADALEYVAKNIQKNVRELEGALNKILGHSEFTNQKVTTERVKVLLKEVIEDTSSRMIGSARILEVVGEYYDVSQQDLTGKSRKKEVVRPRQVAMYLLRQENNLSFPSIGEQFGGRDHTTAMHACEKISKLIEHDNDLLQEVNFVREKLYA